VNDFKVNNRFPREETLDFNQLPKFPHLVPYPLLNPQYDHILPAPTYHLPDPTIPCAHCPAALLLPQEQYHPYAPNPELMFSNGFSYFQPNGIHDECITYDDSTMSELNQFEVADISELDLSDDETQTFYTQSTRTTRGSHPFNGEFIKKNRLER
jgi:hypothetical protein